MLSCTKECTSAHDLLCSCAFVLPLNGMLCLPLWLNASPSTLCLLMSRHSFNSPNIEYLLMPESWLSVHQCRIEVRRQSLEEKRKGSLILCQAKREHSRPAPQKRPLRHQSLGNQEKSYRWGSQSGVGDKDQSSEGLAFFFFLHYFKTVTAGVRQPGNWVCSSSLGYPPATIFLKCRTLQGVICYKRV